MAARAAAPAPLGKGLFSFQQHQNGGGYFIFVDRDDLIDILGDDWVGQVAGAANGNAVGDCGCGFNGNGAAVLQGLLHGWQARGFDADDTDAPVGLLDSRRNPRDETAATDGDDHGVEVRDLLEHLKRERALAGHDGAVVEGVEKDHVLGFAQACGLGAGFIVVRAMEDDLRAKAHASP